MELDFVTNQLNNLQSLLFMNQVFVEIYIARSNLQCDLHIYDF